MKRTSKDTAHRVAVVGVRLSGRDYRAAHEACHAAALLWDHGLDALRAFWSEHESDPSIKQLRHLLSAAPDEVRTIHAHSRQAIADDILDAVATARKNTKAGRAAKMPWRAKNYRPLAFTRNFGWRVRDGRLNLSLGRGRPGIQIPLPQFEDARDGESVEPDRWGEILLCWERDQRRWSLHISYRTQAVPALNPDNVIAIDEGIINPMTAVVETDDAYEVTVINGRAARAVKHRRNTAVADLRKKMARCTKGSRQWRKYDRALKRSNATAKTSLHNIDHQVSRKVANIATEHDAGTVVVGDVRGIERKTRQTEKRRFGRHQRRRLSQWSRGRQERYLSEKTGVDIEHVNEAYSSRTCPACLTRNLPNGRNYRCQECGFTAHRDAVGALSILQRAKYGNYVAIDPDKPVRVTYLRATPLHPKRPAQSIASNQATEIFLGVAA